MIILIGASASGKTEIAKCLKKFHGISKAVTHTSRKPRVGERDGVDYHFVSEEEFSKLFDEGALLEKASYNGNLYGCSKKEIGEDKCLIVEPKGLKVFRALHDPKIVTFFLSADEDVRENRMKQRGDSIEAVKSRLALDRVAFSEKEVGETDFHIDTGTDSIEELTEKIYSLYRQKISRV